ncbi:hypothetical protein CEXT_9421 [Caerostris extrusa]|uniref:Uncharacterized protein n=1 Tax=Caerostris extrusa TaxID=172846 RepID=A0AAV4NXW4_CAEEX|nr:hypothetical protein CEXT_9421 [Caerostris extrusa]
MPAESLLTQSTYSSGHETQLILPLPFPRPRVGNSHLFPHPPSFINKLRNKGETHGCKSTLQKGGAAALSLGIFRGYSPLSGSRRFTNSVHYSSGHQTQLSLKQTYTKFTHSLFSEVLVLPLLFPRPRVGNSHLFPYPPSFINKLNKGETHGCKSILPKGLAAALSLGIFSGTITLFPVPGGEKREEKHSTPEGKQLVCPSFFYFVFFFYFSSLKFRKIEKRARIADAILHRALRYVLDSFQNGNELAVCVAVTVSK